jgi:mannose-6-phosphate isomerase
MSEGIPNILELKPAIKNYAWGLKDPKCWVARFSSNDQNTPPFAEAWFGAHPNGPAIVSLEKKKVALDRLVSEHQNQILGTQEKNFFEGRLPVLPKILSIGEPLSIQLHPSEKDAKRLHESNPQNYPDPFAKDEASVALQEVELLHSLLNFEKILENSKKFSEFGDLIPDTCWSEALSENRRGNGARASAIIFQTLLSMDQNQITEKSRAIYKQLRSKQAACLLSPIEEWILKLENIYPNGDKGVFCFLLFNYVKLVPGEAISLHTGTPHAYLSGELLEVMKPSDNVIRCALTEKYVDLEELGRCLDYDSKGPEIITPLNAAEDPNVQQYLFDSQGFRVEIVEGCPKPLYKQTRDSVHIAVSLSARGTIQESCSEEKLKIFPASSFLICAKAKDFSIKLENGMLALFSYRPDLA